MSEDSTPANYGIIDQQTEEFERMLLRTLDGLPPFFQKNGHIICVGSDGKDVDDFALPQHNALFRVIRDFHTRYALGQQDAKLTDTWARIILQQMASAGSAGVGFDEIDDLVDLLAEIRQLDLISSLTAATEGVNYWLKKQRVSRTLSQGMAFTDYNPDELVAKLFSEMTHASSTKEKTRFSLAETLETKEEIVQRYPTGLLPWTTSMGGGFAKKEHMLIIAPTGGGKTVMACQIAGTLAAQNLRGILVTTEQEHTELLPRFVANFAGIPFSPVPGTRFIFGVTANVWYNGCAADVRLILHVGILYGLCGILVSGINR